MLSPSGERRLTTAIVGAPIPIRSHGAIDHSNVPSGTGFVRRSVKPSASPTLVRTQHLPHKEKRPLTRANVRPGIGADVRLCAAESG
jgi:hypothetical protein